MSLVYLQQKEINKITTIEGSQIQRPKKGFAYLQTQTPCKKTKISFLYVQIASKFFFFFTTQK